MDQEEGRTKGMRKDEGKIYKGTLMEAPMKIRASSIPSKVENVVYNNHHRPAFGNSQQRFYTFTHQQLSSTPPPNLYTPATPAGKISTKKGSLGSQTSRFKARRNWNPGPGNYQIQQSRMKRTHSNTSYLKSGGPQAHNLFDSQLRATQHNPAPNRYQPQSKLFKSHSVASAIFKNNQQRFFNNKNDDQPGVGQYHWDTVKHKIQSLKFSHTSRTHQDNSSFHQKYIDKILGDKLDSNQEIGPGKYNPSLLHTAKTFSIRQDHPKPKQTVQSSRPDTSNNYQEVKAMAKTVNSHASVFKSKSNRYQFGQQESKYVSDPRKYSPQRNNKHSHLINFSKKWV